MDAGNASEDVGWSLIPRQKKRIIFFIIFHSIESLIKMQWREKVDGRKMQDGYEMGGGLQKKSILSAKRGFLGGKPTFNFHKHYLLKAFPIKMPRQFYLPNAII